MKKNEIILGDCLTVMRGMADKSVDLVLTDPPYGGGAVRAGGQWASRYGKKICQWDKAPTAEVFEEIFRVSKNQIIWGGNYFGLPPTRCFNVWRKPCIGEDFTMSMCEYAWCSFEANAKIFEMAPFESERFHPTQKPLALIMRQLELYAPPGALVLDPFSGSGTTAVACHNLGLDFLCVEKDPDYHAASVARLEKHRAQGLLPLAAAPVATQAELAL